MKIIFLILRLLRRIPWWRCAIGITLAVTVIVVLLLQLGVAYDLMRILYRYTVKAELWGVPRYPLILLAFQVTAILIMLAVLVPMYRVRGRRAPVRRQYVCVAGIVLAAGTMGTCNWAFTTLCREALPRPPAPLGPVACPLHKERLQVRLAWDPEKSWIRLIPLEKWARDTKFPYAVIKVSDWYDIRMAPGAFLAWLRHCEQCALAKDQWDREHPELRDRCSQGYPMFSFRWFPPDSAWVDGKEVP